MRECKRERKRKNNENVISTIRENHLSMQKILKKIFNRCSAILETIKDAVQQVKERIYIGRYSRCDSGFCI